jgi:hypothetical protein
VAFQTHPAGNARLDRDDLPDLEVVAGPDADDFSDRLMTEQNPRIAFLLTGVSSLPGDVGI